MDKPILFTTPMIESILDGSKSQTRRIIKIQPPSGSHIFSQVFESTNHKLNGKCRWILPSVYVPMNSSDKYFNWVYRTGDHLWVKETYYVKRCNCCVIYKAGLDPLRFPVDKWKSSLYMPKKYARIWLEVTAARAERLNDISEQDAVAEGIEWLGNGFRSYERIFQGPHKGEKHPWAAVPNKSAITSYSELWDSLHGKGSWEKNPWVWAITFRRIS